MNTRALPRPRARPTFGPVLVLETMPWLMLAAALRMIASGGKLVALPAFVAAETALFLAFVLATRRIIEATGGQTGLGALGFGDQLRLARRVLWQRFALIFGVYAALIFAGARRVAPHVIIGFDGVAFDQFTNPGRFLSACFAAVVLLMILRSDLVQRWRYVAGGFLVVFVFHLLLAPVQNGARWLVHLLWSTDALPQLKMTVYFAMIFGFGGLRLWGTIAILTFALRASYWSSGPVSSQAERTRG